MNASSCMHQVVMHQVVHFRPLKIVSDNFKFLTLTRLVAFVGYDLVLPESLMQISTKATNWVKNRYPFCKPRVFTGTLYR